MTNIVDWAFSSCTSLTNLNIPDNVIRIGDEAFEACNSLRTVTIGKGVTDISLCAFAFCGSLTSLYSEGNVPNSVGGELEGALAGDTNTTVYYLPGTKGWTSTFDGRPAVLWNPQLQTSGANFGVWTNQFGFTIAWGTGMVIVVEACTNLANPTWYPLQTNTLTGASFYFSDSQWTNYPARFYRLRSP